MRKSLLNKILQWSLVGLISFILLEISLHFLVKAGVLNIIMPTYKLNNSEDFISERSFVYGHRNQPNRGIAAGEIFIEGLAINDSIDNDPNFGKRSNSIRSNWMGGYHSANQMQRAINYSQKG